MDQPSRRGFIVGSATTVALFSSSTSTMADTGFDGDGEMTADLETALSAVPAADERDVEYQSITASRVDIQDETARPGGLQQVTELVDVDSSKVSLTVSVTPMDHQQRFSIIVGEFDGFSGDAIDGAADWTVLDADFATVASTDGVAVVADNTRSSQRETVVTAARAAADDVDNVLSNEDARTAFESVGNAEMSIFAPDTDQYDFEGREAFRAFAIGFDSHPQLLEGDDRAESKYALFPADDASPTDETVTEFVSEINNGMVVETTIDRSDDVIHVQAVTEAAPEYAHEAAPDAQIQTSFDAEDGTLTLSHADGEPIPAADLQLWVDGELADDQPVDRFETFAEGDTLDVTTGPIGSVVLRWFDESENSQYVYVNEVVDREAFTFDYDLDAKTITIEYDGVESVDPERVSLRHRAEDEFTVTDTAFASEFETIDPEDSITVENVEIGDTIILELDVPDVPGTHQPPIGSHHVAPPRLHISENPEKGVVVRYHDDTERNAAMFRILVDGEPTSTQPADQMETLSRGDTIALGDLPLGSEVVVEWTEPDDPVTAAEYRVVPRAHVTMEYDSDDHVLNVAFQEGDAIDADDLIFRSDGEPTATQPADAHDSFAPGDSLTADVGPFSNVELVWVNDEAEEELTLAQTMTAKDAFVGMYDADAEQLTVEYTGSEPVDPEPLTAIHRPQSGSNSDETRHRFADEYDELTTGDAVVIENVAVGDLVTVTLREVSASSISVQSIAHFRTGGTRAFTFQEEDGDVTAKYVDELRRDADEFRVLVDGETAENQLADAYDRLEEGDEVTIGDLPVGSEVVIEWMAPEETIEVGSYAVTPLASFSGSYEDDDGEMTIVHEGGDDIAAEHLDIAVPPALEDPQPWKGEGTVTEGDSTTVVVPEEPTRALVVFRESKVLGEIRFSDSER